MNKKILFLLILIIPFYINAKGINLYDVLKNETLNNGLAREYTGEHKDSFNTDPTKPIYHWYGESDNQGNEIANKNNVIFGGFCWQIIRTTDLGGVKLLYNGVPVDGKCTAKNDTVFIGKSGYQRYHNSIANIGYMYNPDTLVYARTESRPTGLFGASVKYENGQYTLVDTSNSSGNSRRYSCNNDSGTCSEVRYYYYYKYYVLLSGGKTIEESINDMLFADNVNKTDSSIKTVVDNWYQANLSSQSDFIEDAIYCNDRSVVDFGSWYPSNNSNADLIFTGSGVNPATLKCQNITDQFSLSNSKAKLTYPIGLITFSEVRLMNTYKAINNGTSTFWTMTPINYVRDNVGGTGVALAGIYFSGNGTFFPSVNAGVRPVITLKNNIVFNIGDGSKENPYAEYEAYYSVTVMNDEDKGNVKFDIEDLSSIEPGVVVRFRVSPNSGFNLDEYELVTSDGQVLGVTRTEEEFVYEFKMPEKNVVLTIQYKNLSQPSTDSNKIVDIIKNPETITGGLLILAFIVSIVVLILTVRNKKYKAE